MLSQRLSYYCHVLITFTPHCDHTLKASCHCALISIVIASIAPWPSILYPSHRVPDPLRADLHPLRQPLRSIVLLDGSLPNIVYNRPIIFVFDLKPMQQLAATNSYFNILAPPIAGHLSTPAYDGLFQASKVIYPGYAENFRVSDLQTLVGDTFLQRWSIHLQKRDFYLSIDTDQGIVPIHDGTPDLPDYTLLDFLNWFYPTWKTHQHLNAFTARPQQSLCITPHPDSHDIAFTVQVRVTPCGHPFFSTSSR